MSVAARDNPGWSLDRVQVRRGQDTWPASPLSLRLDPGHTVVLGLSGAGKTTLLNLLVGFVKPDAGTIESPAHIGWVPQNHGLWLAHTVREHLSLAGAVSEECEALLRAFDLWEIAGQRADRLSHGESARLAVARALAQNAPAIVMDEPLAHVDTARAGKYWREIRARIAGRTAVIATHQPEVALGLGQRAICLRDGVVSFDGDVCELYKTPGSTELASYLGPINWLTPDDAELWLGGRWPIGRGLRPESLSIEPTVGGCIVEAVRFLGSYTETDLRHPSGAERTFVHYSFCKLPIGTSVGLKELPRD